LAAQLTRQLLWIAARVLQFSRGVDPAQESIAVLLDGGNDARHRNDINAQLHG